jgi:hypothetical protein
LHLTIPRGTSAQFDTTLASKLRLAAVAVAKSGSTRYCRPNGGPLYVKSLIISTSSLNSSLRIHLLRISSVSRVSKCFSFIESVIFKKVLGLKIPTSVFQSRMVDTSSFPPFGILKRDAASTLWLRSQYFQSAPRRSKRLWSGSVFLSCSLHYRDSSRSLPWNSSRHQSIDPGSLNSHSSHTGWAASSAMHTPRGQP